MNRAIQAACLLLSMCCAPAWAQHAFKISSADTAALESLEIQPDWMRDYGTYLWLEGGDDLAASIAGLDVSYERLDTAGVLRVHDRAGDPLTERAEFGIAPRTGDGRFLGLVQFRGPLLATDLADLRAAGLEPIQYYPNQAYLVWGGDSALDRARGLPQARWSGDFGSEVRIQPDLSDMDGMIRNVNVHFYNDGNVNGVLDALRAAGASLLDQWSAQPDGRLWDAKIEVHRDVLDALAAIPQVVSLNWMSPEPGLDDESGAQTLAGNLDGDNLPVPGYMDWLDGIELDGTGVTWAVVDTGVWYGHGDYNSRIVGGVSYPGTSGSNPGDEPASGGGHGTHVAGIIGGDGSAGFTDGLGHLYGLGVAPGYGIFAQNALSGNSWPPAGGWPVLSRDTVEGGAIGSNNSWHTGQTPNGYQNEERTHDLMVLDGNFESSEYQPAIMVFSAGNSGPGAGTLTKPKEAKNLIVTGGTQTYRVSNNVDAMYNFSSRGPAADGRTLPTIAAPAQQVSSTIKPNNSQCGSAIAGTNGAYAFCSGTSMAAPHASGAVVLMAEWWRNNNGGEDFSPAMAKALLVNSATAITGASAPPNNDVGWGRIDLRPVLDSNLLFELWDEEMLFEDSGEEWSVAVNAVDPARPFKVSLVWSDAPGAVGANPALVNDLDLEVEMGGETYLGNVLSGGWSVPGGTPDRLNNLESVFVEEPAGGAIITVRAHQIAGSVLVNDPAVDTAQHFALVCQNCLVGTPRFVGGEVQGLAGEDLVLQNNGVDDLEISEDGPFTFPGFMIEGQEYAVTVIAQPVVPEQECEVENGEGSVGKDDVSDVLVTCETLPVMAVTSPALDFGEVHVFDSQSLGFEIENIAPVPARPLEIVSIQLTSDAGKYSVTGGDCHAGIDLAAGTSCVVEVTFGPEVTGEFAGNVVIESADGQIAPVELNGIGVQDPGELEVGPQALNFGEVGVGDSAVQSVAIGNISHATAAALELGTVEVIAGGANFVIEPDGSDCGATLAPQLSCAVTVEFTPADETAYAGVLRVVADEETVDVVLSGDGIQPPAEIFEDRFEQ